MNSYLFLRRLYNLPGRRVSKKKKKIWATSFLNPQKSPQNCIFFFANEKPSDFLQRTFHGCSTQGRVLLKKKYPYIYISGMQVSLLSTDDVGVSSDTAFREIPPGAGFLTADFVQEKLGEGGLP